MKEKIIHTQKLFGEASYRVYSRITTESGKTYMMMQMPKGQKMSASEEITNIKKPPEELPYINVQRYLKHLGLPVPEIISSNRGAAQIILEDLGDTKLEDIVKKAQPDDLIDWYKKAIDLLIELQTKTEISTSAHQHISTTDCIAFQRSFDAALFNWEFEHFWEYYCRTMEVPAVYSWHPWTRDLLLFKKETTKITEELCKLPQGFTHRDFQSRNLMVQNGKLYMIDFQDALMGPKVYDLVCLLRDSYMDISPHLERLLGYYCEKAGEDLKTFLKIFDLQTVQRKLKDAGRFVFINKVKKNPNFLKHIPASLHYVAQALKRLPEYKDLYELLKKYVKEWK